MKEYTALVSANILETEPAEEREEMDEAQDRMIYDAMLDSVFADWQSLEAYKVHPEHKKVSAFCKSVRLSRAAVDLIID